MQNARSKTGTPRRASPEAHEINHQGPGGGGSAGPWPGDEAVPAQHRGQALDECGEQGAVGPVQPRPRIGSTKYRDLVAQDEQLNVFGRGCAAEQCQPAEEPDEDQSNSQYLWMKIF